MIRAIIKIPLRKYWSDHEPILWPVKHPYWLIDYGYRGSGFKNSIIMTYADSVADIHTFWPDVRYIDVIDRGLLKYTFTEQFPRPEWLDEKVTPMTDFVLKAQLIERLENEYPDDYFYKIIIDANKKYIEKYENDPFGHRLFLNRYDLFLNERGEPLVISDIEGFFWKKDMQYVFRNIMPDSEYMASIFPIVHGAIRLDDERPMTDANFESIFKFNPWHIKWCKCGYPEGVQCKCKKGDGQ